MPARPHGCSPPIARRSAESRAQRAPEEPVRMTVIPSFHPVGLDRDALRDQLRSGGFNGLLLTSPENVFYTTGYTSLPSAGNPILYTLRSRMPYSVVVDREGRTTLLCWGFSAQDVDFGADRIVGFNDYAGALERLREVLRECLP